MAAANENATAPDATRLAAEALAREKARQQRLKERAAERRRWLMLLVFVLALLVAMRAFAPQLVRVLPGMAGVYEALGVPVAAPGFRISNVRMRWMQGPDNAPELLISGHIANTASYALPMPHIVLVLTDAGGSEIHRWRIPRRHARPLKAGARIRFRTRLTRVPERASALRVHVVPASRQL